MLSADERKELDAWRPPFLELPVHAEIRHQFEVAQQGVEHTLVLGPPGVGKTVTLTALVDEHNTSAAAALLDDPTVDPTYALMYTASDARGPKTGLIDLYEVLAGRMGGGARRSWTPRDLIEQTAAELRAKRVTAVVIDEAHKISPQNIDLIRQVPDATAREGHPVGLILAGTAALRDHVAATAQLGQRFSCEIAMGRFKPPEIAEHLDGFHPHLPRVRAELGAAEWRVLTRELFDAVQGSMRRLVRVLANANLLALKLSRPVDAEVLRFAVDKLGPEE